MLVLVLLGLVVAAVDFVVVVIVVVVGVVVVFVVFVRGREPRKKRGVASIQVAPGRGRSISI